MSQPIYHEYDFPKIIVLACEICGTPVLPEFRNNHTLWHRKIDKQFTQDET